MNDSCFQRSQNKEANSVQNKEASGVVVYLLEELGDARLRCAQLKKFIDEAVNLINKSEHRDHFFEAAAHLIYGVPDTLLRMDKALSAAALAASKLDYEEIKDELRPEKVEELEKALEEVRVKRVKRQSEEKIKIPTVIAKLEHLAASTEATGKIDSKQLAGLVSRLEGQTKTASSDEIASAFRELAISLVSEPKAPSRLLLASTLRKILADTIDVTANSGILGLDLIQDTRELSGTNLEIALKHARDHIFCWMEILGTTEQVLKQFIDISLIKSGPLKDTPSSLIKGTQELTNKLSALHKKMQDVAHDIYDVFMGVSNSSTEEFSRMASEEHQSELEMQSRFEEGKPADPTENMSPEDVKKWWEEHKKNKDNFKEASEDHEAEMGVESRFEEGKPADPTQNMNEEDAKKWKAMNEEHGDRFKSASWKL